MGSAPRAKGARRRPEGEGGWTCSAPLADLAGGPDGPWPTQNLGNSLTTTTASGHFVQEIATRSSLFLERKRTGKGAPAIDAQILVGAEQ